MGHGFSEPVLGYSQLQQKKEMWRVSMAANMVSIHIVCHRHTYDDQLNKNFSLAPGLQPCPFSIQRSQVEEK